MKEITYDELKELDKDSYVLVDIRDESNTEKGMIPEALHIQPAALETSRELADIPL